MIFKKIMSVLASAAMIGSTAIFASASVGNSGVFGDNTVINAPGSLDAPAANGLQDYIASLDINETIITNETIIEGEMAAVKTSSQPLYLGDDMSITKATFTETQLPNVLASGEVDGDDGKDYEYNLKIDVPNSITEYGEPEDNIDKAIIYADFSTDEFYNLRVIFPTAVDVKELAGESIILFGKEFTFSEDEDDLSNKSITLFEKSSSIRINNGETVIVEGHEIRADVEDTDHAVIYVDGVSKNVNDNDWSGKIGGVDIYVKNIFASTYDGGQRYVQISLNAEKLTLSNGDEIERGTSSVDGTDVEIKISGNKVREIVIKVTPNDIELDDNDNVEYLGIGDYLIDPVFKTIKFSFDSVTPDLKSDDRDYIKVKTSGDDDAVIRFTNKAGKEYNFKFIEDDNLNFLTSYIHEDEYFITGNNEYSQIWKVENINDNEIRVRDQGEDSDYLDLTVDNSGIAELPLADGSSTTISFNDSMKNSINVSNHINYIFTENGANITFVDNTLLTLQEETNFNGGYFTNNSGNQLGEVIKVDISYPSDIKLSVSHINHIEDDDEYGLTRYGTYIHEYDGERVELYYPENAMELNFHIGEIESQISTEPVLSEGEVSKVIVGGSCINQAAADLLGIGRLCGADFTAATGIGAGQALIQVFADTDDKVAVLVAGYETADTSRAVDYIKTNNINLTPGSKIVI